MIGLPPKISGRAVMRCSSTSWAIIHLSHAIPLVFASDPALCCRVSGLGYPCQGSFHFFPEPPMLLPVFVGFIRTTHRDIARDRGLRPPVSGLQSCGSDPWSPAYRLLQRGGGFIVSAQLKQRQCPPIGDLGSSGIGIGRADLEALSSSRLSEKRPSIRRVCHPVPRRCRPTCG